MRIPYGWVREFVDLKLSPPDAADRLVNAGIEVASVTPLAPVGLRGAVIGEIEAIERDLGESRGHHLVLCRVRAGKGERFSVVCGAPNTRAGVRAAFAPPGATLPGLGVIAAKKIHGVESQGILCSERELGLGDEHEAGLLLLDRDAPVGGDLAKHLGLSASPASWPRSRARGCARRRPGSAKARSARATSRASASRRPSCAHATRCA